MPDGIAPKILLLYTNAENNQDGINDLKTNLPSEIIKHAQKFLADKELK